MCKVSSSLPSHNSEASLWFDFVFAVSLPSLYRHLFLRRSWENPAMLNPLLTYLDANYFLVLSPTWSTAYQDVMMGR